MKRKVIETEDGSTTILMEDWGESFHSIHGAIQEAQHVYIQNGLRFAFENVSTNLNVLEIGFGTGLNCFLTLLDAHILNASVNYHGVEGFPLKENEWKALNYHTFFDKEYSFNFEDLHQSEWGREIAINEVFSLTKHELMFEDLNFNSQFDLVYFDAFGYQYQPELWSKEILLKVKKALKPNGILVTYACKGVVNRTLKELGFKIEKLEGPPGKREMTRAVLI